MYINWITVLLTRKNCDFFNEEYSQTHYWVLPRNDYSMEIIIAKSVSMRKPIKTIELNSAISFELFTNGGLNTWMIVAKKYVKIFYSPQVRATPSRSGSLTLIYAYLTSQLCFSISSKRKALWRWNPLDHIIQQSV